jgi:hypothetical protein
MPVEDTLQKHVLTVAGLSSAATDIPAKNQKLAEPDTRDNAGDGPFC